MESRFGIKDLVFVVLLLVVGGMVGLSLFQFGYQEQRLNDLRSQMLRVNDEQKQQTVVLMDIRNALRSGVTVAGGVGGGGGGNTTAAATQDAGRIRRRNPDGSQFVYYPTAPTTPRDPHKFADFAYGDWLVQDEGTEPKVIAPYIEKDYSGQQVQLPVLESLVGTNFETYEYEPVLAESYWVSGDGLTFRFTLRKGVNFSDGSPILPEDVVFSFTTLKNEEIDADSLRSYFTHVVSCKKIDDRSVEFKMDEPYFQALGYIGGLQIMPEHVYKFKTAKEYNIDHGDRLVGSGPYVLDRWDRGQKMVFVRNDKYWGDRPVCDRMIFRFTANPQAQFQSFQNGEIDDFEPDADQYATFSQDPNFLAKFTAQKYLTPLSGYNYIGYNEKRPMFKDKLTRQAMTMLLDRKAIIHTFMKDIGAETVSPFSPASPAHDPAIKPWPYDPDAASKKLAEAGWKMGDDGVLVREGVKFEFDLSIPADYPLGERLANYAKSQFEKAGIRCRITPWEFKILISRQEERNFDAMWLSWLAGSVEDDPYQIWHSKSMENKGDNFISFDNKESDRLLDEARRTLDDDKRMALWHQWEALIHDEEPYTFVLARMSRLFANGRFENTLPYRLDKNIFDWYVPAAKQKYR